MALVVDLTDIQVRRGAKQILVDANWQVEEDERWVVLGPNGSGKTTLMQIVAGRLHPTSGKAVILGKQLGRVDVFELRPRIGFSSAALADHIPGGERVRDVVMTAAYGVTGRWREDYEDLDTRRTDDLLAAFGVLHLQDRTFGTLSEGERKRTQIARALMTDPEILLLDEPGSGLDLGGREEVVAALSELAGDPLSPVLILVTHHVEEIPPGFTHCLLLEQGKIHSAGLIDDVLTSENVSAAFGMALQVQKQDGRWRAWAQPAGNQ